MSHPGAGDRGHARTISAGAYTATAVAVGATLDSLTYQGRDLVLPNPPSGPMLNYRGAIVAPWPNRVGDGRYTWNGQELQLPLNEPERGNALHGLMSFAPYEEFTATAAAVEWGALLHPTPGYPFLLQLRVRYELEEAQGLTTTVTARNVGSDAAPFGVCPHPYLVAGPGDVDDWTVTVPAASVMTVDDRLLPTGIEALTAGDPLDLRTPQRIGAREIDHCYTDIAHGADGTSRVQVHAESGTGVELSFGEDLEWLQVHTADRPEPEQNRKGLAVEPMSCPPDALRSGTDLIVLEPGQERAFSWSIRAL